MTCTFDWTDETIALLKQHFELGLSSGQSALRLGTTRGTVSGKRARLGLRLDLPANPVGVTRTQAADHAEKSYRSPPVPNANHPWRKAGRSKPSTVVQISVQPASSKALLELGPRECRWAVTTFEDAADTVFCAHPTLEGSWCARHFKMAYAPADRPKPAPKAPYEATVVRTRSRAAA